MNAVSARGHRIYSVLVNALKLIPALFLTTRTPNRVLEHEVFQGRTELLFMDPAVVACMMNQCDGERWERPTAMITAS